MFESQNFEDLGDLQVYVSIFSWSFDSLHFKVSNSIYFIRSKLYFVSLF